MCVPLSLRGHGPSPLLRPLGRNQRVSRACRDTGPSFLCGVHACWDWCPRVYDGHFHLKFNPPARYRQPSCPRKPEETASGWGPCVSPVTPSPPALAMSPPGSGCTVCPFFLLSVHPPRQRSTDPDTQPAQDVQEPSSQPVDHPQAWSWAPPN